VRPPLAMASGPDSSARSRSAVKGSTRPAGRCAARGLMVGAAKLGWQRRGGQELVEQNRGRLGLATSLRHVEACSRHV
jgi:hypothetical protein